VIFPVTVGECVIVLGVFTGVVVADVDTFLLLVVL